MTPKRNGKIFAGWFRDAACTQIYSFGTAVTADVTLYAKWENLPETSYILRFNPNTPNEEDESSVVNMPDDVADYMRNGLRSDFTSAVPDDPEYAGYSFAGWYYNRACTKIFEFNETYHRYNLVAMYHS